MIGAAVGAAIGTGVYWLAYRLAGVDISQISSQEAQAMQDLNTVSTLILAIEGALLRGIRPLRQSENLRFRRNINLIKTTFREHNT